MLADGRLRTINELKPGDLVRSGPRLHERATVDQVFEHESDQCREVRIIRPTDHSITGNVVTTDEHLFWVDGKGWTIAYKLQSGDWLLDSEARRVRVVSNQRLPGSRQVHTIKLRGDVAFYAEGVLVHDLCGGISLPQAAAHDSPQGIEIFTRIQDAK